MSILQDEKLRTNRIVLTFLNMPASVFAEIDSEKIKARNNNLLQQTAGGSKDIVIDSAQKWLDVVRDTKSLLQDVRSKLFSNLNLIDCKKKLNAAKSRLDALSSYLVTSKESIGAGELKRRRDLLTNLNNDYNDLNSLTVGLKLNTSTNGHNNDRTATDTRSSRKELFLSGSASEGRRVLGKPKETSFTRQFDNKQLMHQQQQVLMKRQDQDLESLRGVIQRQRAIGTAINEELAIQNDMLGGLNDQIDQSQVKMNHAKQKINRLS
ncbi:unnamed protein product [Ambrosiozyma monospora]|uniref:Unnamed protein product n=1 Tax=Ambrosiozyma monospora TaxID=43982 RepID=A0ACB5T7V6_AMBMO|nr:unnamed protein product [Ambrosiozyma monospora]